MAINFFLTPDKFVQRPSLQVNRGGGIISDKLEPIFVISPSIEGEFKVGQTLRANPGRAVGNPMPRISYQWLRDGVAISHATNETYIVTNDDLGKNISLKIFAQSNKNSTSLKVKGDIVPRFSISKTDLRLRATVGDVIGTLSDPFAGLNLGATTYRMPTPLIGSSNGPVANKGTGGSIDPNVYVGNFWAEQGATYPVNFSATSGDGSQIVNSQFIFNSPRSLILAGPLSFKQFKEPGSLVAYIDAVPDDVVPTFIPNDGRLALSGNGKSGWRLVVGNASNSVGTFSVTVSATGVESVTETITVFATSSLPSLPLPVGAKLLSTGHQSIELDRYSGDVSGQVACSNWTYGIIPWCRIFDKRMNVDCWQTTNDFLGRTGGSIPTMRPRQGYDGANISVEAETLRGVLPNVPARNTKGLLSLIPAIIARSPAIVFLEIGDNDVQGGQTAAQITAHLDLALAMLTDAGIHVIITTLQPAWPSWSADQIAVHDAVDIWIKAQSSRTGVKVADLTSVWNDKEALQVRTIPTTGQTYYDALTPTGAYKAAVNVVLPLIQTMVAAGETFSSDPTVSNLFPNYAMTGTTAVNASIGSGTIPTGYSLARLTGTSTIVGSQEAIGSTGRFKQVLTITPVADGVVQHRFRFARSAALTFSSAGFMDGDWVKLAIPIEFDNWAGWDEVRPKIDMQGSTTTVRWIANFNGLVSSSNSAEPGRKRTPALEGIFISEPTQIIVGKGLISFRLQELMDIYFNSTLGGTGTIKIGNPILRKVDDPRPLWNL